jgi:hypothetical protein
MEMPVAFRTSGFVRDKLLERLVFGTSKFVENVPRMIKSVEALRALRVPAFLLPVLKQTVHNNGPSFTDHVRSAPISGKI